MSFAPTLAVYFTIQKHLGKKALFPGNQINYKGILDFSNASQIAHFAVWSSTNPQAENNGFIILDSDHEKVTNEQVWKAMAQYFGVEVEEPTFSKTSSLPTVSMKLYSDCIGDSNGNTVVADVIGYYSFAIGISNTSRIIQY
jgi:hypothetical protein